MNKISYLCAWIITYFLLSLPTVVRETQPWNTTLIPKGITSSLKSEHSDSLTTTIRCTFIAKFWPVINTLQTPGELTNSYNYTESILLIKCSRGEVCTRAYWPVQPRLIPVSLKHEATRSMTAPPWMWCIARLPHSISLGLPDSSRIPFYTDVSSVSPSLEWWTEGQSPKRQLLNSLQWPYSE